jgi:hypothetical protein
MQRVNFLISLRLAPSLMRVAGKLANDRLQ